MAEKDARVDRTVSFRGAFRYKDHRRAFLAVINDSRPIFPGEPSQAFYPPYGQKVEVSSNVILEIVDIEKEDPEMATATDIANRMVWQNERYIELEHYAGHPAKIPIGWLRYGMNHWDEIQALKGNHITSSSSPKASLPV